MKPPSRHVLGRWNRLMRRKIVKLDGIRLNAVGEGIPDNVTRQLWRGSYEYAERKLLLQVLRPDDVVLEVGAGIGALGLVAARVCGAHRVLSFEADPATMPVIAANQELNNLFPTVRAKAITTDGGVVNFYRKGNIISSSLIDRGDSEVVTIESESLQSVLTEFGPTVLLMDAEGAELDLLPSGDLSRLRAMIIETHAKITGHDSVSKLKNYIRDQGFRISAEADENILCVRSD